MRRQVMERVRAADRPVVLFDVDSTLLSTSARHLAILRDFAATQGDSGLQAFVETLTPADFGWTVTGPLEGTEHLTPELHEALMAAWFEGFFSERFLHHDQAVLGAVEFVNQVHKAGAFVYYLTARHLPEMGSGTATTLLSLGFPLLRGGSTLHLKPTRAISDKDFKAHAVADVARLGTVVATYENDPANANLFLSSFPDAVNVLLDTVCAPDAPVPEPGLLRIPNFGRPL